MLWTLTGLALVSACQRMSLAFVRAQEMREQKARAEGESRAQIAALEIDLTRQKEKLQTRSQPTSHAPSFVCSSL